LLRVEEPGIQIMRLDRVVMVAPFNVFNKGVKLFTETLEEVADEFRITERLPNGGKCIRQYTVTVLSSLWRSASLLRIALERAMVCEEKLESSVVQASRDMAAKSTVPATEGVNEDWMALSIA
jgi:hypothetical protein